MPAVRNLIIIIIIVYYAEAAENKTHSYYTCIHDKTVQAHK